MTELMDLVRAGDADAVAALLAGLTPEQRRAELPALRARRTELRDRWSGSGGSWTALLVAGAGCHTAPTAAADWLGSRVFENFGGWRHPALLMVVERQPAEWRAVVVARLAERRAPGWGWSEHFQVLEHLIRGLGCPVPTADPFVLQWQRERSRPDQRGPLPPGTDLYARLATDPFTPVLAPRLFEVAELGSELDGPWAARTDAERWPAVLARLAADGVLDRADLVDRCLARLLRGGRPAEQRSFLAVLRGLAPDEDEYAARVRTLLGLLEGPSTVAGHAQQVLTDLERAGRLAAEVLDEASATVLFRPEKKLVRAQLGWLDRAARADRGRSGPVVLAAAAALGHPDRGLQEQALKLVARHLPAAGPAVLPALREAAAGLDPAHHARAAELFGTEVAAEAYRELLPPVPQPRPVPPPIATAAELAEELGAVLAGDEDPVAFERVLDGLVRHAFRDGAGLAAALAPVLRQNSWHPLRLAAEAAAGMLSPSRAHAVSRGRDTGLRRTGTAFDLHLVSRIEEAVLRLTVRPLPYLLATPTEGTGALAADVLAERIAGYHRLGVTAGPVDLAQALLRVAPPDDPQAVAAVTRTASPDGERLARWLRTGGLPHRSSEPVEPPSASPRPAWRPAPARRLAALPGSPAAAGLPADTGRLLRPLTGGGSEWHWSPWPPAYWAAVLPHHREVTAAQLLHLVASAADQDVRGRARVLPYLAESGGPAGLAVHLAVAYGLAARHREDRTAAVDALLVLAARGDLDGALLGREAAALIGLGAVRPTRLVESLRAAADTGAHGTVWSVLAGLLPALLAGEPGREAGELLALGADCARRCGAKGPIAEVTAVAGRGGTTRRVREAAALQEVLAA
ncbi:DUF6493 family protein [Kitasatospora sp. NPDC059571]|uniref:DUF6493 family protein n=1 Tax=Kitasatospora sp. NPDC059571 TaxID=3346871 RepID=UPI00369671BA